MFNGTTFEDLKKLMDTKNKVVVYKGMTLAKGSIALELWEAWQKESGDRGIAQRKLDAHMKDVEKRDKELLERYK